MKPFHPSSWIGGERRDAADPSLARFTHAAVEPERARALRADHPALHEARTIFPSTVTSVWDSPRMLVSGHNNAKLGADVRKGARAGAAIYQLTLEERATCPRSCAQWATCYGNAMHLARRHRVDGDFLTMLEAEVRLLARQHRREGLLIRLHTLGDFFSVEYVALWAQLLEELTMMTVFGFTACASDDSDPRIAAIGQAIEDLRARDFEGFAIRTSRRPGEDGRASPTSAIVVDTPQEAAAAGAILCPAQTGATAACATCGLCWAPAAAEKPIAFLRHGMKAAGEAAPGKRRGRPPKHLRDSLRDAASTATGKRRSEAVARQPAAVGLAPPPAPPMPRPALPALDPAAEHALIEQALAAGKITVLPPGEAEGAGPLRRRAPSRALGMRPF